MPSDFTLPFHKCYNQADLEDWATTGAESAKFQAVRGFRSMPRLVASASIQRCRNKIDPMVNALKATIRLLI